MSELARSLTWQREEAELVTELQVGSDTAFEWLVTYCHASVYNLAFGMLNDATDAADVTQEVFLRAFRGIRGFRRGSSLKTWLYRITVREALNHRRWCWRHLRRQVSLEADSNAQKPVRELPDDEASPFDQLASRERQSLVRQALMKVPEAFRSAVILRDMEGLSYEEVAEVLEVTEGTVKSRILRGRRALREILDPILRGAPASPARQSELAIKAGESFVANLAQAVGAIGIPGLPSASGAVVPQGHGGER